MLVFVFQKKFQNKRTTATTTTTTYYYLSNYVVDLVKVSTMTDERRPRRFYLHDKSNNEDAFFSSWALLLSTTTSRFFLRRPAPPAATSFSLSVFRFILLLLLNASVISPTAGLSSSSSPRHYSPLSSSSPSATAVGICAGCALPIARGERFVTALDQAWHPEHLTCRTCQIPLSGQSFYADPETGRIPYCENCHADQFRSKCMVCQQHIQGRYFETFFGDCYCARHEETEVLQKCVSCSRPVGNSNAVQIGSGKCVCGTCRSLGTVDEDLQAQQILTQVVMDLQNLGFQFPPTIQEIKMELVESFDHIIAGHNSNNNHNSHMMEGNTQIVTHSRGGRMIRTDTTIQILRGLPTTHFASIVAHELGHFYLQGSTNQLDLSQQQEEGLCELMSCAWLATQWKHDIYAQYRYETKLQNPDPIYGGGLRMALDAVGGNALQAATLFEVVKQTGRFPLPPTPGSRI